LTENISKTVTDKCTRLDPQGALTRKTHGLSIDTVRFDFGWPWWIKNQGHTFWCEVCRERQELRCWTHGLHLRWPRESKGQGHKQAGDGDRHVGTCAMQFG